MSPTALPRRQPLVFDRGHPRGTPRFAPPLLSVNRWIESHDHRDRQSLDRQTSSATNTKSFVTCLKGGVRFHQQPFDGSICSGAVTSRDVFRVRATILVSDQIAAREASGRSRVSASNNRTDVSLQSLRGGAKVAKRLLPSGPALVSQGAGFRMLKISTNAGQIHLRRWSAHARERDRRGMRTPRAGRWPRCPDPAQDPHPKARRWSLLPHS